MKTQATKVLQGECKCGEFVRQVLTCSWERTQRGYLLGFNAEKDGVRVPTATLRQDLSVWNQVRCACGKFVLLGSVKVRKSAHPCGAACTNARGLSCECECGGLNHGCEA